MATEIPKRLKRGEDSRDNWKTINKLVDLQDPLSVELSRLASSVATLRAQHRLWSLGICGNVDQFRFKSMNGDTITCVRWNGETEGAQVTIWKPYLLRRTPFDGKSRTLQTERTPATLTVSYVYASNSKRIATSGEIAETQYITPRYSVDDIIFAMPCPQLGGDYIDLNADGRAWAEGE